MNIVNLVLTFCLLYTIELNLLYTDSLNIPTTEDISLFDPQVTTEHPFTPNTSSPFGHSLQQHLPTNVSTLESRENILYQQGPNIATRTWMPTLFLNVVNNSNTTSVVKSRSFAADHETTHALYCYNNIQYYYNLCAILCIRRIRTCTYGFSSYFLNSYQIETISKTNGTFIKFIISHNAIHTSLHPLPLNLGTTNSPPTCSISHETPCQAPSSRPYEPSWNQQNGTSTTC